MTLLTAEIRLEGNFFKYDPGETLRQNVRDMNDALAVWAEDQVRNDITSHAGAMPEYSGWSWAHTVGRTHSQSGKRWGTWLRVSANTTGMNAHDAIRTKAAAATIERRWHPYRRVKRAMYRARPLISANLTKGLE